MDDQKKDFTTIGMSRLINQEFGLSPRQFDAIVESVVELLFKISRDVEKNKNVEFELINESDDYIN